jgi:DNA integrity scanning protein DisA with diadenylate cyclase activity
MVARMGGAPEQKQLMRAVYASCLDASFARTGACIAIANDADGRNLRDYLNRGDLLLSAGTEKATLLSHLIGLPFQRISRPVRQEVAALDGAVVLDREGVVLAAGAIVRVPGGSEGGGRRAAAIALSRLGLAVKVSADGGITAFAPQGPRHEPKVAFEVCV